MRWIRGIAALATMAAVIVGAPVVLLAWGRLATPGWWARAEDGSLLLAALTLAGWVAWALFVVATGAELARLVSGNRFELNLPLLGGLQAVCASLLFAVVALAAASPAASSGPAAEELVAVAPPEVVPVADRAIASPVAPEQLPDSRPRYTVVEGDDLWTLSDTLLGDGRRWRDLMAANPDVLADPTAQLAPGTDLVLPAPAPEPAVAVPLAEVAPGASHEAPRPDRVTVVRGDTLSELAEVHLGEAAEWPKIYQANRDLIDDPDHIEVGWTLTLPAPHPADLEPSNEASDETAPVNDASDPEPAPPVAPEPAPTAPLPTPAPATAVAPVDVPPAPASAQPPATAVPIETAPTAPETPPAQDQTVAPQPPDAGLIGSLGGLAAAALIGGWQARRLLQARVREPGRRVLHPDDSLARFHDALGRRQGGDPVVALDGALRAIAHHHHSSGEPLPRLAEVVVASHELRFRWTQPAGPPPLGFGGDPSCWLVELADGEPPLFTGDGYPCAYPALVSLGAGTDGETVMVDAERAGVLGVAADSRDLQLASLASMAVELGCAPWSAEVALTIVGSDAGFALAAGGDRVTHLPTPAEAVRRLRRRHAERLRSLAGEELSRLRTDPERAEAVAPEVYLFLDQVDSQTADELDELLAGTPVGIAVVMAAGEVASASWQLFGDPLRPYGRFESRTLQAHAVPEATRVAVESLYRIAESRQTDPAPWWAEEAAASNVLPLHPREPQDEEPMEIVSLRRVVPPHPTLLLLGPVDLLGAQGPEPTRARTQLIEICSWILEHPGRTASQMASGLGIAEGTRRSNMSRLRSWLGDDADGSPYLPDAYSGRIRLHPEVTSDAHELQQLTGPGVNRVGDSTLVAALDLVRGDILADAVPGQWFWAEELRSDLSATIRDAGLVLVDRALARRDVDLARWAAERALVVAPEDELLMCARIRTEHLAGNTAATSRLVARLAQQARALGVDLLPETVLLCQQVVEGRLRARQA